MKRENKRRLARAARYIGREVGFANEILNDEEDRLDGWAENFKDSERYNEAEGLLEDIREQFDIITDAVAEIRSLCGITE